MQITFLYPQGVCIGYKDSLGMCVFGLYIYISVCQEDHNLSCVWVRHLGVLSESLLNEIAGQ